MINVNLDKNGLYRYTYAIQEEEVLHLEVAENVHATCIMDFSGAKFKLQKQITLYSNSSLHILYRNECEDYVSDEKVVLHEAAFIKAGYYELGNHKGEVNAVYELIEKEAKAEIITTTLARTSKTFNIVCEHKHAHTYSMMENYAINDKCGQLNITASGKIEKGAKGSKSHQSTRVLTLADGDKEKVSVTPLLYIDENDVEASHACGIGEMNEDHLYYLQTRGLDKRAALGLLTLSYILPILKIVEHENALQEELEAQIQREVGL